MKKIWIVFVLVLWNTQTFAQVIISEIAWMGTLASHYDEWIELFNPGSTPLDLTGWTLEAEDGSPSITLNGNIEPNGFFILERTDDNATSLPANQIYSGGLSNAGEVMFLKNGAGDIIDQTPDIDSWSAGNNEERRTMERTFPIIDGTLTESWHTFSLDIFGVLDANGDPILGSPGSESSPPPILPNFTGTLEILDLFPILKSEEAPWLRFSVTNSGLFDITDWSISNGDESQIFTNHLEHLTLISGGTSPAPGEYISDDPEMPILFEWKEDLLPLPETGLLFIQDEIPATLSQKQINTPQILISEISINHETNDFIELFVLNTVEEFNAKFLEIKHNGTRLFFAENSLNIQEGGFLTFDLKSTKIQEDPVRYLNTTTIRETGTSYIWESSSRNGLNGSSGTMEVILFSDTQWEANPANGERTSDFLCWHKESLSETELNRLAKNTPQNWQGECVNTPELITNESIARTEPQADGNTSADFFRHFNGSPGGENIQQNHPPIAKFYIQGSQNITTSANLSAIDEETPTNGTTDPDGDHDLKYFSWTVNGKTCGNFNIDGWEWRATRTGNSPCNTIDPEQMEWTRDNPDRIYFNFDMKSSFEVLLTVEDYGGEISRFSATITKTIVSRSGSNGAFENSIKSWIEKEFAEENSKQKRRIKDKDRVEAFFEDFLLTISGEELVRISYRHTETPSFYIPKTRTTLFQRDKYTPLQLQRMQKNIGLTFLDPHATAWGKLRDQTDPMKS